MREHRDVAGLVEALRYGKDGTVRASSAATLGQLGDARAVVALANALTDEAGEVRSAAAHALGRLGDARAVEALVGLVTDRRRHSGSRLGGPQGAGWAAAMALGMIGDRTAVEPLAQALDHEHRNVRRVAAVALAELGDARAIEPLVADLDGVSDFFWKAIKALRKIEVPTLLRALGDGRRSVRRGVAHALGYIDTADASATTALVKALGDPADCVRASAAGALGRRGDPSAGEALIRALADECWAVRECATQALADLGDVGVIKSIQRAVRGHNVDSVTATRAIAAIRRRIEPRE